MGASVIAYWPEITEEQLESQPGFYNDTKAWGDWMAVREEDPAVLEAIEKLDAAAILSFTTNGLDAEDVFWVAPAELRDAASKLKEAIQTGRSETKVILDTYQLNANGVAPVSEEFIQDLEDIVAIANWAEEEGASRMTLEVNW